MGKLLQDIHFAVKMLRKSLRFTIGAVLCLALAFGVGSSLFLFVYATLLRALPVADPDRLVWISSSAGRSSGFNPFSYPNLIDLQQHSKTLSGVAGYVGTRMSLRTNERTQLVRGQFVTTNYFSVLGIQPPLGRAFRAGDPAGERQPEVVLSHGLWQRRFASNAQIIGQPIVLDGHAFTVIGVAPESFHGTQFMYGNDDFWLPILTAPMVRQDMADRLLKRNLRWLEVMGRLAPGVTIERAQADLTALAAQLESSYPDTNRAVRFNLYSTTLGHPTRRGQRIGVAIALMATTVLIVLFASLNVTSLVLARMHTRLKEIGVRVALGASPGRILGQLVAETVLLFLAAGCLAILLAAWTGVLLARLQPPGIGPVAFDFSVDGWVVLFTFLLALLPGLIFGLAPALLARRLDVAKLLRTDFAVTAHHNRRFNLRNILLASQIAISLVLLIGAVLLVRSMLNTAKMNPGFANTDALMCTIGLRSLGYDEPRAGLAFHDLLDHVRSVPAVRSAALVTSPPLGGGWDEQGFNIEGTGPIECETCAGGTRKTYLITFTVVSEDYFRTLGVQVLKGRDFGPEDRALGPFVAIVNRTLADRFWPGENPIGKHIVSTDKPPRDMQVAGVVATTRYKSLVEDPAPFVYLPMSQFPATTMTLLVHGDGSRLKLADMIRHATRTVNENIPVYDLTSLNASIQDRLLPTRAAASLLGFCGLLALALAAVGIYGLVSYSVAQRGEEIGVRMALGARPRQVMGMIVRENAVLLAVGALVGLGAAVGFGHLIRGFLFGVAPTDATTYAQVVAFFAVVALIASFLPARQASRVDPVVSLRRE